MNHRYKTTMKIVPSFEKVMLDSDPRAEEYSAKILKNERLNFQLVFKSECPNATKLNYVEVQGTLAPYVTLRSVENVPVSYTAPEADEYYLDKRPGLYPDVLRPFGGLGLVIPCRQWKSVWVSVEAKEGFLPIGEHALEFVLFDEFDNRISSRTYVVKVLDVESEKHELKLTNWMHYDSICDTHKVKPFTDKFYAVFENYLKAYVDIGMNMLLIPLFTPPLDTALGGERRTVQLVNVAVENGKYSFDFSNLEKFIDFARKNGIRYFEFGHLLTQWGGEFCPKILIKKNGRLKKSFGWRVSSASQEYRKFLEEFLPALYEEILKLGIKDNSCLHLTDEPEAECIETYGAYCELIKRHMRGIPIIDAMSEPLFYEKGLVDIPVSLTKHYERFLALGAKELIVYNCCFPNNEHYSLRFINAPGVRLRILGTQLYATGAAGFSHWGFNFYGSVLSLERVNPYAVTDACGFFPGGDGFIVYPTERGVHYSLRAELMREAIQDYCALKTLEKMTDKQTVQDLIDAVGIKNYNVYPQESTDFSAFRNRVYDAIEWASNK